MNKATKRRMKDERNRRTQTREILYSYQKQPLVKLIAAAKAPLEKALSTAASGDRSDSLVMFFSFSDGLQRATVLHFSGKDIGEIWKKLADWRRKQKTSASQVRWLRVDWVAQRVEMSWEDCLRRIQSVKRNYFRYGISLDTEFRLPFLEQELNANAMLYLGAAEAKAGLNEKNFTKYGSKRFPGKFALPESPHSKVALFTTKAMLFQPNGTQLRLNSYTGGKEGRNTGRRTIRKLNAPVVTSLIEQASQYLADQVDQSGRFTYGIHPCFDRDIRAYNTLRHASTTYSMLEAWEVTGNSELKEAIERSLTMLTTHFIHQHTLPSGEVAAYLQEQNNEIKLGGNAVSLLALVKYTELTGDSRWSGLMDELAVGIEYMQDPDSGRFNHVLEASDLRIKEPFRVIYYEGEAAFGLMRLYGHTKADRWLRVVERAFQHFIESEHWKSHDHWLSYCVNELTMYRPKEEYYRFGLKNVSDHLNFVIGRITTYPTLLELMMAAHKMLLRLRRSDAFSHLLDEIDIDKFYRALDARAHYLLNGFFWPEYAIYFKNPQRILGSFFIRHHSFRVRIDDVEHYLSGYCAYLQHYLEKDPDGLQRQK